MWKKRLGWGVLAALILLVTVFFMFQIRQWEDGLRSAILYIFTLGAGTYCFRLCIERMKR